MTLALRVEQGQRLATTPQMRLALDVLSMSTDALCDHLRAAAAANPFLDLSWPSSASGSGPDDLPDLAEECGLYAHVLAQIPLCLPAGRPREIALCFADALEPTGWLGLPLDRIAAASGCSLNEARSVLDGLQRMEPAGLFARDLRECLRLQAADLGCDSPAMLRILDRLDLVAAGDPAAR